MTLMVALVGEQPQPNFLAVLHCHPSDVLFLYTQRTKPVYERLEVTLQQKKIIEGKQVIVHGLETDPYDIATIVKALNDKLDKLGFQGASLIFNLTGGTKAMAFAAYQVAQQRQASVLYLQSEGRKNLIYSYIWGEQQLHLSSKDEVAEYVELRDLLNLQFGPGKWREDGPDISKPGGGGIFEQALLDALCPCTEYEIMAGVKRLQMVKKQKGMQEVEVLREVMDIDILIRYQNQYGIIEAKMGTGGGSMDGIRQLVIASRQLGTYTHMFYAITVPPTPDHEEIRQAFSIRPISLLTHERDRIALTSEDATKLISIIGEALKSS